VGARGGRRRRRGRPRLRHHRPAALTGIRGRRIVSIAKETPGIIYFIVEPNRDQLGKLARLADEGAIRPEIDSVFPLADARAAFDRVAERGKRGKVVLRITGS